uniref:Uncharacterized protein n=1 Tax=Canis lupus dingo TaxID=286419 RepID=A0A8C0KYB8_CANLU
RRRRRSPASGGSRAEQGRPPGGRGQVAPAPGARAPEGEAQLFPGPSGRRERACGSCQAERPRGGGEAPGTREGATWARRPGAPGAPRSPLALAPSWPLPAPWDQAQRFANSAPFSEGPLSAPPSPTAEHPPLMRTRIMDWAPGGAPSSVSAPAGSKGQGLGQNQQDPTAPATQGTRRHQPPKAPGTTSQ